MTAMRKAFGLGLALAFATPAAYAAQTCPADQQPMQESRLFFGRSISGGGAVTDAQFAAFLKAEVVPRFPDGFTVMDGIGYWKGCTAPDATGGCERSKVAIFLHAPDAAASKRVSAVARAYAVRFHQQAVLRADAPTCVAFIGADGGAKAE
ncbi:DUF3574 domain-containing protein [Kordiimonas marina]|uniref:DUF3574 domain-containing protein n=1 Tax=Kordiimonas marina TaxID=2872312 RepID=UPI001FF1BD5A|nr:DUF3574 domain-containing protein [Kordiimonas marina]MCJ9429160.1 DUF3574 domain-containing protein [Kordiimonas marina]